LLVLAISATASLLPQRRRRPRPPRSRARRRNGRRSRSDGVLARARSRSRPRPRVPDDTLARSPTGGGVSVSSSEHSARGWLERLADGECSSRELVEDCLERIGAVNGRLNAVVSEAREAALAAANRADRHRREGRQASLLGLPVTVKDALEVRGLVSAGGSYAREGFVPTSDATVVARL